MEFYDQELSEDEILFLEDLRRRKKRKIIIWVSILSILLALFIGITIMALLYQEDSIIKGLVLQNDF